MQVLDVHPRVRFGVDRVVEEPTLLGPARAIGLVTNDAARLAVNASVYARVALQAAGVPLVRLFSPEHGLGASASDGAAVTDSTDARTGLPVVSLYGERLWPTREQIAGLDLLLFDVPDIGARFHTYASTLHHLVRTCAEAGLPLVVLDRPNPLGGELSACEGPMLDESLASFIGADRMPIRHGLTLGELATLWQRERWPDASLRVIACAGWRRTMRWPDTGLPWVPTSPSMPSFASALCYPGTCLFEGTNLSVGRGTDEPFQHVGAPWFDPDLVMTWLARASLPGVTIEHDAFVPDHPPFVGERCQGLRVIVTDAAVHQPVALGLRLLASVIATQRAKFVWTRYPTAANPSGDKHFDLLIGRHEVREQLDASAERVDAATIATWTAAEGWRARVAGSLLYGT